MCSCYKTCIGKLLAVHSGIRQILNQLCCTCSIDNIVYQREESFFYSSNISGNCINYTIQSKQNRHLDQHIQTAACRRYSILGINCLNFLILCQLCILILTILVFCLNCLNLRIHLSRKFGEFLLLDGKRHHQQVYNNCKKNDCKTDIRNTDQVQNFEDSFHYLTQQPGYLSDNECGILCQKNTVHLSS